MTARPPAAIARPVSTLITRAALLGVVLFGTAGTVYAGGAPQPAPDGIWIAYGAGTTLRFNTGLLRDLGVEIRGSEALAAGSGLRLVAPKPWSLRLSSRDGIFEDVVGGSLRHLGGFDLAWDGGSVTLVGFELRPGRGTRSFELTSAAGELIFTADHMHFEMDVAALELRMFNLDLRLSEAFAERLGDRRYAGLAVGTLELVARVEPEAGAAPEGGATCSSPDWLAEVDVALIGLSSIGQSAREAGERVAITPSATLENVGTADVPWYPKFTPDSPPHDNDQHPFLVWALYRVAEGAIEQLGQSDVKHAFFTVNTVCSCAGGNILWAGTGAAGHPTEGCQDTYGSGTNQNNGNLGPRDEITASGGLWTARGSHFDQNGDGIQDHNGTGEDGFAHALVVAEPDLETVGAQYYYEAWYVVRGDVDIFNTMGYLQVTPSLSGNTWRFNLDSQLIPGPAINAWVDPLAPPANARNETLDTGEGHLQLAVTATDQGVGIWRYEYALMNHDFDRRIRAFEVPLASGMAVTNLGFNDLDQDPDNDWQATQTVNGVTWQAPTDDDALDWGTLFNFRFDSDRQPIAGTVTLEVLEPGAPATLAISATVPEFGIFSDGFESGDTSRW